MMKPGMKMKTAKRRMLAKMDMQTKMGIQIKRLYDGLGEPIGYGYLRNDGQEILVWKATVYPFGFRDTYNMRRHLDIAEGRDPRSLREQGLIWRHKNDIKVLACTHPEVRCFAYKRTCEAYLFRNGKLISHGPDGEPEPITEEIDVQCPACQYRFQEDLSSAPEWAQALYEQIFSGERNRDEANTALSQQDTRS
jgi:hypothetical protein